VITKVAILIPTKNKSEFINRQLDYYMLLRSNHPIYIGDSSNNYHKKILLKTIDKYKKYLDIKYFFYPKLSPTEVHMRLANQVNEKFCTYCGDDDFFVPNSLTKCANFLKKNKTYRTVQGKSFLFSFKTKGSYGKLNYFSMYWNYPHIINNTAKERIMNYLKNSWVAQFSVHRTVEYIEDSNDFMKVDDRTFTELIHNFTFIAQGKSKFIDCLYLFRQSHAGQSKLPDFNEWLISTHWNQSYNTFMDSISKILVKKDGLNALESRRIVNKAFWIYNLTSYLSKLQKEMNIKNNKFFSIKKFAQYNLSAKQIDFLRKTIYFAKEHNLKKGNIFYDISNKKSKYYDDFLPWYQVILNKY